MKLFGRFSRSINPPAANGNLTALHSYLLPSLHKIGDFSLEFEGVSQASSSSKRIQTGLEWQNVWNLASDGYLWLFPHREPELKIYFAYIQQSFAACVGRPSIVIQLDKAIRNRVSDVSSGAFHDLYTQYIVGGTVSRNITAGNRSSSSSVSTSARLKEICNNFNEGRCHFSKYVRKHVCAKCSSSKHGANSCTQAQG